jgi:hypothetical protein
MAHPCAARSAISALNAKWLVAAAFLVTACGLANQLGPRASVTFYGRNAVAEEAWFVVRPISDPPASVGFGRDSGVACFEVPVGSELVMTDRAPGPGANVIRVIAPIDDGVETLWVDVAANGTVTTDTGVPAWWPEDQEAC